MSYLKNLRSAIEAKGFIPIDDILSKPKHDVWYRFERATESVEYLLYLRYMPSAKGYGVYVGVSNIEARNIVKRYLPIFEKYIDPSWLTPSLLDRPCWQIFNASRAMNWEYGCIPQPAKEENWRIDLDQFFREFIDGLLFSIKDVDSIISLLLKSTVPFEWFMTNPTLRVLEIAVMAKMVRADVSEIRASIEKNNAVMRISVPGGNVEGMISDIFDYIFSNEE